MKVKKYLFVLSFAFLLGLITTLNSKDAFSETCTSDQTCSGEKCSENYRGGFYHNGDLYCCEVLTVFKTNYKCKTQGSGGESS
jgi:hypothetical protein